MLGSNQGGIFMASFRKTSSGKWNYRIRYKDKITGRWKEISKEGFHTKKEAQLAATAEEEKINRTGIVRSGEKRFGEFAEHWLQIKKNHVRMNTFETTEYSLNKYILTKWSNYSLKEITTIEYQKWIQELLEKWAIGSVKRYHSIMMQIINSAVYEHRLLEMNVLTNIHIKKYESDKVHESNTGEQISFFTYEQLQTFLEGTLEPVKNAKYKLDQGNYALFYLLAHTGLRFGEVAALTWDDIEDDVISVDKAIKWPKEKGMKAYQGKPKTESSVRKIQLSKETIQMLQAHKKNQKLAQQTYKYYKVSHLNLIFPAIDGSWLRPTSTRQYMRDVCKRKGLPVLSPHDLRHTHAVQCLEAGYDLKTLSARLGHKSIQTTADTYLHITKKVEIASINKLETYLNEMKSTQK